MSPFLNSAHTDCIVADDQDVVNIFLRQVDRYSLLIDLFLNFFLPPKLLAFCACYYTSLECAVLRFSTMQAQGSATALDLVLAQRYNNYNNNISAYNCMIIR